MLLLLPTTSVSTAENALVARKELAPTGKLRFGLVEAPKPNVFFVIRGADGKPEGVTADLGNALARTLDVAIEFFVAHNSGELTDALENEQIDAAFLPVDDERKKRVDFGPFQSLFESTCLVLGSSDFKTISDLDRPGVRVVGEANTTTIRAAARTLKLATILPASSVSGALEMLRTGQADAFALGRDALVPYQKEIAGSRILDGYFHRTGIAIAVPKNRPAALAHAKAFIEQSKNSGLIRRIFDRAGLQDTAVAPSELRNTLLVSRLHCAFAILAMLRNARLATLNGSDGIASR
jgi:polar amino acid transport system substrate-binding protein